jgi:hypothetical protein
MEGIAVMPGYRQTLILFFYDRVFKLHNLTGHKPRVIPITKFSLKLILPDGARKTGP